jgi:mycothiol synthase
MSGDAHTEGTDRPCLPGGYRLRRPRPGDAAGIAELICQESMSLAGFRAVSADWITTRITKPGYDAARYSAMVEADDGAMAGFLHVDSDPPHTEIFALGVTAIAHHGRGIGASLLAEAERRGRTRAELAEPGRRVVLHAGCLADEPRAAALLAANGYREVRRFGLMRLVFDAAPTGPDLPAGVSIDRLRRGSDEPALYELLRDAFADHWGEGWPTYDVWLHELITGDANFDPELWYCARAGGELVGVVVGIDGSVENADEGYISDIGVHRDWRRRGVGEALLRTAIGVFYERGRTGVSLHVDEQSQTGATRLYARVGMRIAPRYASFEKELCTAATA